MSSVTLTKRDQELLNLAFLAFTAEPKVDYKHFAQLSGMTEGSARTAWSVLKKKVLGGGGNSANGGVTGSAFKVRKPRAGGNKGGKEKGGKEKGKKGGKRGVERIVEDEELEEGEIKEEIVGTSEAAAEEEEEEEEDGNNGDEAQEVQEVGKRVKVEVIDN